LLSAFNKIVGSLLMRFTFKKLFVLALTAAIWPPLGSAQAAGNPNNGEQIFQSQCAACHGVTPGASGFGPSLGTVYGKPAGGTSGYDYSPAMKNAHLVWDAATLDHFLESPQEIVPGTKMPFGGLDDPQQRQDVIAYLAQVTHKNLGS
jgi:cytochrome c